jgi:hypothetical protein
VVADCYFKSINYGLGVQFILQVEGLVTWSIDCTDGCNGSENWVVSDELYDVKDITITTANPALCALAARYAGIKVPAICLALSAMGAAQEFGPYIDDAIRALQLYLEAMEKLTPDELAELCIALRK